MDEQTQDLDELTPETDAPEAGEAPAAEFGHEEIATSATTPTEDGEAAASTGDGEAEGPQRPREVIKGIHPELKCECPECAPEFTELQWFSPEEEKKTKGQVMLYCQRSSRKYFSPAVEFQAWLAENKVAGKKRRDG